MAEKQSIPNPFTPNPDAPLSVRKANLARLRELSPTAQQVDFTKADGPVFDLLEEKALSEAKASAHDSGQLFEYRERDDGGRMITKFEGDIDSWMRNFKAPVATVRIDKFPGRKTKLVSYDPGEEIQVVGRAETVERNSSED